MTEFRKEHDLLGELEIYSNCYYGIQTQRAIQNFPVSGIPISHFRKLIRAFAYVKKALETGMSIADVVLEEKLVSKEELEEILKPENMIHPKNFSRGNAC